MYIKNILPFLYQYHKNINTLPTTYVRLRLSLVVIDICIISENQNSFIYREENVS